MLITRREILQAIRHEPLRPGSWIYTEDLDTDDLTKKQIKKAMDSCPVCAVGGVLRSKGINPERIDEAAWRSVGGYIDSYAKPEVNSSGDEERALEDKNYLQALSIKFEKLAEELGTGKRLRKKLAEFVKQNFPKQINVKTR